MEGNTKNGHKGDAAANLFFQEIFSNELFERHRFMLQSKKKEMKILLLFIFLLVVS